MEQKKIVIADDVELFLMLEKTFFNREGFELITARNGREALEAIRNERPDLVFLDLHMPEMDGDECCRHVKGDDMLRHIPIVMVTSAGREADVERCRSAGCDEIVHKPINRHDFMATARRFLQVTERSAQRFGVRLRVHYGAFPGDLLNDYSIDLSTGGLFLATDHILSADTPLNMEFMLPENEATIRCKGRVAWINDKEGRKKTSLPAGMGVQFLDLTLADLDAIRDYIKKANLEPLW
ncbi:MAG TPA: TIGR02266 family protein [Geobacteraceae bacterium]|nr:TIGR02266 family protein [Geobacteraceae bacterium]